MKTTFRYKQGVDVLKMLKNAGYNTNRIRQEKIFGQRVLQKFRNREMPSWNELERLCKLLSCQPWEIIEYTEQDKEEKVKGSASMDTDDATSRERATPDDE